MHTEVVTVTPEQAEAWLLSAAEKVTQRSITRARVNQYAGAMQRGQWRVTHQAIALDPEGVLLDGQHRLTGVVQAGVPVAMTVTFGVPRESMDVIDIGYARSPASILSMAGFGDTTALAATARFVMIYDQLVGTSRMPSGDIRGVITPRDVLNFMESDRGALLHRNVTPARLAGMRLAKVGIRTWLAAAMTVLDEATPDQQLRDEFVDRLISGAMLAETSPIMTLRRWILSENGYQKTNSNARQQVGMAMFIKAWNAWVTDRTFLIARFLPGRDLWPAVEEVTGHVLFAEDVTDPGQLVAG